VIIRNPTFDRTGKRGYHSVIVTSENPSEGRLSALLLASKPQQELAAPLVNPKFLLNANYYFHMIPASLLRAITNPTKARKINRATETKKITFTTFPRQLSELHSFNKRWKVRV
jgi:hypothetical protein